MSCNAKQRTPLPCRAVPCCAVPCHAVPCRAYHRGSISRADARMWPRNGGIKGGLRTDGLEGSAEREGGRSWGEEKREGGEELG